GTEMFQFPGFPSRGLCVHPPTRRSTCVASVGFPIRTSPDIAPAHGSPRLFAVFHVLLRRLTPRHPPYALSSFLHVMRSNCSSTLTHLVFRRNELRYAVGKELVAGCVARRRPPKGWAFRARSRSRRLRSPSDEAE